ncbi:phosphate ABC transporter substrate-binding protein [Desulfosarcina alkanivorans]|uniref:Phosphate ABC transporter substrate-binding protein n=1 Tax=Desulfosarcina alkanivorans TaxID=571177 RepID=A0A5K7YLE3_9BACT|nr:substrate-binding domain-containing protein [Desulfosarcina alkanivorans]BBO69020.1 phosphate ABC transporter substrate-binding protein [Desulfosarcina alkanivorans]
MKKSITSVALSVMCLFLCGPVMADEITIVGTGSGSSVLKAIGDAFSQRCPGVTVAVPKSIGSGGGIKAVGSDKNVIGRVARGIKDKEKSYGLSYMPYAKNPIIFFTNKSVGIDNLTARQVCEIYSGKITNWKDVGGRDARIRVIRREDGDSSLGVLLKSFPGFSEITLTPRSKTTLSDPSTCELAESKADAIAFGTYANARNYNVDILTIDGKAPTEMDYPYAGTLALIFKEKNKTGSVKKFVEFSTSSASHAAIRQAGALPVL